MRFFVEATVKSTSPSAAAVATVDLGMGGSITAGDSIAEAKGGSSVLLSGGPSMMSTHTDGSVAAKYVFCSMLFLPFIVCGDLSLSLSLS